MDKIPMRLMKDRRYAVLPIDKIVVLNSRDREESRFAENVESIRNTGLRKPVLVNERFLASTGKYELVCGEGRLLAHQRLNEMNISAEVIDCDRNQAYLTSLVENIARVPPGTMWFAHEVKRMRDGGMTFAEIARIVGRAESHVIGYINLVEKGEERLVRGVEQGVFPITFALRVAESNETQTQALLMDAFKEGVVGCTNFRTVRKIIVARLTHHKRTEAKQGSKDHQGDKQHEYTLKELKRDIARTYREKASFVHETNIKQGRVVILVEGLKTLLADATLAAMLKAEGLDDGPELHGLHKV
jgi:ParB family chromosome partitioning protein